MSTQRPRIYPRLPATASDRLPSARRIRPHHSSAAWIHFPSSPRRAKASEPLFIRIPPSLLLSTFFTFAAINLAPLPFPQLLPPPPLSPPVGVPFRIGVDLSGAKRTSHLSDEKSLGDHRDSISRIFLSSPLRLLPLMLNKMNASLRRLYENGTINIRNKRAKGAALLKTLKESNFHWKKDACMRVERRGNLEWGKGR